MIAHLAPQWNQVDNYLVQGRDFLLTSTPLNAVKIEIGATDDETFVVLSPTKVRLPPLQLDDLEVPTILSQQFRTQPTATLSDMTIGAQWIHVLPSLKRGRIISVTRQIPASCPYQTYKDMKRHWKNSYGYRLPECGDDIIYYTLSFHPMIPTKYTYPSTCVRSAGIVFHGRVDETAVLQAFLTDLHKKLPRVCGQPLTLDPLIGVPVSSVSQWGTSQGRPNLAVEKPSGLVPFDTSFLACKPTPISRHLPAPSQQDMFTTPRPNNNNNVERSTCVSLATPQRSIASPTQRFVNVLPTPGSHYGAKHPSQPYLNRDHRNISEFAAKPKPQPSVRFSDLTNTLTQPANGSSPPKYIPYTLHPKTQQEPAQKYIPQFTTSYYKQSGATNYSPESAHSFTSRPQQNESSKNTLHKKLVPQFAMNPMNASGECLFGKRPTYTSVNMSVLGKTSGRDDDEEDVSERRDVNTSQQPETKNKFVPLFHGVPRTQAGDLGWQTSTVQSSKTHKQASSSGPLYSQQLTSSTPCLKAQVPTAKNSTPSFSQQLTSRSPCLKGLVPTAKKRTPSFSQQLTSMSPLVGGLPTARSTLLSGSSQKKRNLDSPIDQAAKKPRAKPQVQTDVDVAALAAGPGLATVNAVTLVSWLRGKNVPCAARDKKHHLVEKVQRYLNMAT